MLLADLHVHTYPHFNPEVFLSSARDHMAQQAARLGLHTTGWRGALVLTDPSGADSLAWLREQATSLQTWQCKAQTDESSLLATHRPTGTTLALLAGRQLISQEGLEVLALLGRPMHEDRRYTAVDLCRMIREEGALPVLPWAFGKWTGSRGEVIRRLIAEDARVWLADNANRPRGTARPKCLRDAGAAGRVVLTGSDPLPLPKEDQRAGSAGIVGPDPDPAASIEQALRTLLTSRDWTTYARLTTWPRFAFAMVAMQLRKRRIRA